MFYVIRRILLVGFASFGLIACAEAFQDPVIDTPDEVIDAVVAEVVENAEAQEVVTTTAVAKKQETVTATVSAYNTVVAQTDDSPCEAARSINICGRRDVVACPRDIPLGTWVQIRGKRYECLDRTAKKYDGRFDISFDKDVQAAINWGVPRLPVTILRDS